MELKHISFIADGNRRWAKGKMLPRGIGHKKGFEKIIEVADHCADLGIPVVSFFAFSTENWNREKDEIDEIFRLIQENIEKQTAHFIERGIRVVFWGDLTRFPENFQTAAKDYVEKTKNLTNMTLALCVNYGGRADIVHAVNKVIGDRKVPLTEETFSKYLYGAEFPDPDIVVRTSGEHRISNFMLWQMAYSELFFIDTFWPDMTNDIVDKIIADFQRRDRRKGK